MISTLSQNVDRVLRDRIQQLYGIDSGQLNFTIPPKIELGELALTAAFELGKRLRRSPREIALELAREAQQIPGIRKVEVAGAGYLNLHLDRAELTLALARSIGEGLHGRNPAPGDPGKVIVEHTNINPNKAAHIGHLRNAAMGDSFVRCLRFLGNRVEVQNYLDNTGVQVADVVVGLERMEGLTLEQVAAIDGRFDYYCWDVYARVAEFYSRAPENLKWRSATLQAIEAGNNPTAELAQHVATRIVRTHLATMARINVGYDLLPRESEILHLRFWDKAFQLLKERHAIYFVSEGKNRGCWVMRTGAGGPPAEASREDLEDEEKIIVRSDGTVTYVGKDIAYQLWKFGLLGLDFQYRVFETRDGQPVWITTTVPEDGVVPPRFGQGKRVYNVIDARQSYLQGIVLQGLQALGYTEEAANSVHFSYEMVALTPSCCQELGFSLSDEDRKRPYVEVSGRKGLGVKADDLVDALLEKARAEVDARHRLPPEEACEIARVIAVGALRYFLLRFARNTVIAFDFREALNFDGETGPYVQYAVVRANNIFRKLEEQGKSAADLLWGLDRAKLSEFMESSNEIWEIVFLASRLPEVVRQLSANLELSQLAKYSFALAQKFNLFYHRHHILSEPDPDRQRNLLLVVDIIRKQLEAALRLLGCEVPRKM